MPNLKKRKLSLSNLEIDGMQVSNIPEIDSERKEEDVNTKLVSDQMVSDEAAGKVSLRKGRSRKTSAKSVVSRDSTKLFQIRLSSRCRSLIDIHRVVLSDGTGKVLSHSEIIENALEFYLKSRCPEMLKLLNYDVINLRDEDRG